MEPARKIELPTITEQKSSGQKYTKPVLYDEDFLRNKNIREWQEGGKTEPDQCVIFNKPNDMTDITRFAMSKQALVEKLTRLGIIEVVQ